MKRTINMPNEEITAQKSFPVVPEGTHKFQVTDVYEDGNNPDVVSAKLEVISENGQGISLLHRLNLNETDKFFWLTRLFLKAIGEPHKGTVAMDTDFWIGRQLTATVKHTLSGGKTYANIKEIIITDDPQPIKPVYPSDPKDIAWDN